MASNSKTVIFPGDPPLKIFLRRASNGKKVRLKILPHCGGKIELVLPQFYPANSAIKFAKSKEDWLRNSLKNIPPVCKPDFGMQFPVEGKLLNIVSAYGNDIFRTNAELRVPVSSETVAEQILRWGMQLASERAAAAAAKFSTQLYGAMPVKKLSIKDPISRWGSCSSKGNLMFSWRLVMAPFDVMEYVVAHEVAHLKELNHSRKFWNTLEEIFPNHIAPHNWLKLNGKKLHNYDFT